MSSEDALRAYLDLYPRRPQAVLSEPGPCSANAFSSSPSRTSDVDALAHTWTTPSQRLVNHQVYIGKTSRFGSIGLQEGSIRSTDDSWSCKRFGSHTLSLCGYTLFAHAHNINAGSGSTSSGLYCVVVVVVADCSLCPPHNYYHCPPTRGGAGGSNQAKSGLE
jgi:hypothetical protein